MKCVYFALLLLLVLTAQTTAVLAADGHATVAGEQKMGPRTGILSSLPSPETLHRTICQSPVRIDDDETAANLFSPYDIYYASGLYGGNDENSFGKDEIRGSNSDVNDTTTANAAGESPIAARLRCDVQRYMSRLAAYGKMAAAYASQYWEQAEAFRREQEKRREVEEAGVNSRESFDRLAIARRITLGAPTHLEPVEYLYVATCNDASILATLGKLTGEYRSGSASHATLVAEFYRIDAESFPTPTPTADFAMPRRYSSGATSQDEKKTRTSIGSYFPGDAVGVLGKMVAGRLECGVSQHFAANR